MFGQRNRKSFSAPKIFGGAGTSGSGTSPLLASAQTPAGQYARLSETSLAGNDSPSSSMRGPGGARYGPQATVSSFTSARYGPTADSPSSSSHGHYAVQVEPVALRTAGSGAGTGPMSGIDEADLDDQLHTFTAAEKKDLTAPFTLRSWRGWANALTLLVMLSGFVVLFAGYPILSWYYSDEKALGAGTPGFNLGGVNASGQYPEIPGFPRMIDPDTPKDAYTHKSFEGETWDLVFSDEFEKDGRTFFEGDDPFFTAMDIHYWPTNDFEWYDPSVPTTRNGHLVLTLTQEPVNGLMFKSGMIQTWNKLCFNKNAYFEVSASLPGTPKIGGFWPGIWTMGNLGRAGYGGTNDGMWPYSYSSCDIGIMPNQSNLEQTEPLVAFTTGDRNYNNTLSYLPGQRLSSCNCPGYDHPGPEGVGRGAVEIDMIEAQMDLNVGRGMVSQSAQVAPYDDYYQFDNSSDAAVIYDKSITRFNTYLGSVYQQAVSGLSYTESRIYSNESAEFGVFGFEYSSDYNDPSHGYIHWTNMGKPAWTMWAKSVGPNPRSGVGQRLISQEPMYMIFNLGMSNNFEYVDFANIMLPNEMRIDYVRVYQRPGEGSVGCDPADRPTAAYIEKYAELYNNPNITVFPDASKGREFPKNRMTHPNC
ncbi:hypothetical protein CspHIS471_0607950 [Cutaneotrichosporon sp. HIS471]|nr:hypothetical protein CspHIS471_0607950 [Cutaneotrichosporon sp. HIS471]